MIVKLRWGTALIVAGFLLVISGWAHADEVTELFVKKGKTFVSEHPVLASDSNDQDDLVRLWVQVEGLKQLIQLYVSDPDAFARPGDGELRPWMVHKRIASHHSIAAKFLRSDDPYVRGLAQMLYTHAALARMHLDGRTDAGGYAEVAGLVQSHGRFIATQVNASLVPEIKPIRWGE